MKIIEQYNTARHFIIAISSQTDNFSNKEAGDQMMIKMIMFTKDSFKKQQNTATCNVLIEEYNLSLLKQHWKQTAEGLLNWKAAHVSNKDSLCSVLAQGFMIPTCAQLTITIISHQYSAVLQCTPMY